MPEEIPTEDTGDDGPKGLREALDRREAELTEKDAVINQLNSKLMASAFETAGLNPLEGLGKAVAKLYDGEPDAAAVATYAKDEFGWEGPPRKGLPGEVAEAQARTDAAQIGSQPLVSEAELTDQITTAERAGDWQEAVRRKVQLLDGIQPS